MAKSLDRLVYTGSALYVCNLGMTLAISLVEAIENGRITPEELDRRAIEQRTKAMSTVVTDPTDIDTINSTLESSQIAHLIAQRAFARRLDTIVDKGQANIDGYGPRRPLSSESNSKFVLSSLQRLGL
jgi:hypothetical protein